MKSSGPYTLRGLRLGFAGAGTIGTSGITTATVCFFSSPPFLLAFLDTGFTRGSAATLGVLGSLPSLTRLLGPAVVVRSGVAGGGERLAFL